MQDKQSFLAADLESKERCLRVLEVWTIGLEASLLRAFYRAWASSLEEPTAKDHDYDDDDEEDEEEDDDDDDDDDEEEDDDDEPPKHQKYKPPARGKGKKDGPDGEIKEECKQQ
eukprot:g3421.t1